MRVVTQTEIHKRSLADADQVDGRSIELYKQVLSHPGLRLLVSGRGTGGNGMPADQHNGKSEPRRDPRREVARIDNLVEAITKLVQQTQESSESRSTLEYQGLVLDPSLRRATIDGHRLNLTQTEFSMLWMLAERPGHVVSRQLLLNSCRNQTSGINERTVDAHVRGIRRKLEYRSHLVETVRGVGYRLSSCHFFRNQTPSMSGSSIQGKKKPRRTP